MAKGPDTTIELDMTPMIDCVFLLLIFFMCVSEIAKADLEELTLPYANYAEPDQKGREADKTVVVNVKQLSPTEAKIRNKGTSYTPEELDAMFRIESLATKEKDPETGLELSTLNLLIRADENAQWSYVQTIFDKAQKNGIWKTILGASPTQEP